MTVSRPAEDTPARPAPAAPAARPAADLHSGAPGAAPGGVYAQAYAHYLPAGGDYPLVSAPGAPVHPYPRFVRPRGGRAVAGVAAGLSAQFRLNVALVRVAFLLLSVLGGIGVAIYALLWVATPSAAGQAPEYPFPSVGGSSRGAAAPPGDLAAGATHRSRGWALVAFLAGLLSVMTLSSASGLVASMFFPFLVVGVGAMLAWQSYDRGLAAGNKKTSALFMSGGAMLVVIGIIIVVVNWEHQQALVSSILAVVITLMGVIGLGLPLWLRLWDSLLQERLVRAQEKQRAEIAARLHDSVLQTLALIQQRAQDPAAVARLARGQERQLRAWLFDAPAQADSLFVSLADAAGDVEDLYGIRVTVVTVGDDVPPQPLVEALTGATRESLVNVAKHAGVDSADLYVENFDGQVDIFIRDRGRGFDPEAVPADRQGVASSIRARVEAAGGTTRITSSPGRGTEIALSCPLPQATGDSAPAVG
ncbi:ATP-binding protein [Corynebacterium sp. 13CS0277]|uniref:ATP-binding protein n=1 Tax=Corynebacterium sp. 13CS0277 TaxID=2071994 RepID=UPI000D02A47F|nr:ATP-binding protein [Corynebacterium sp. 13CS0277]PRQ11390.1 ATP-binding protein [Corynebacterium sp. 13CS0277]